MAEGDAARLPGWQAHLPSPPVPLAVCQGSREVVFPCLWPRNTQRFLRQVDISPLGCELLKGSTGLCDCV